MCIHTGVYNTRDVDIGKWQTDLKSGSLIYKLCVLGVIKNKEILRVFFFFFTSTKLEENINLLVLM